MKILNLLLSQISPDPGQPRKLFADLDDLAQSIRVHGVLQPICVRPAGNERYTIVFGERRYRAAKLAELSSIPAIIRDEDSKVVQVIENLQRRSLSPMEEAKAIEQLLKEIPRQELAKVLGMSESNISQTLSILRIAEDIPKLDAVSKSALVELAKIDDPEEVRRLVTSGQELSVQSLRGIRGTRGKYEKRMESISVSDTDGYRIIVRGPREVDKNELLQRAIELLTEEIESGSC